MNKARVSKILFTVLCFAMIASLSVSVFANGSPFANVKTNQSVNGSDKLFSIGSGIASTIRIVGIIISIIVLMVLGIKYMMGSAEEKAEYKKTFIPYLVGAILLFAASAFAESIYNLISSW